MTLTPSFTPASVDIVIVPPSMETSTGLPVARDYVERPAYEGSYEVIPSNEAQIIPTKNLRMTDDLVINPIPNNWGRIGWDGSIITVS